MDCIAVSSGTTLYKLNVMHFSRTLSRLSRLQHSGFLVSYGSAPPVSRNTSELKRSGGDQTLQRSLWRGTSRSETGWKATQCDTVGEEQRIHRNSRSGTQAIHQYILVSPKSMCYRLACTTSLPYSLSCSLSPSNLPFCAVSFAECQNGRRKLNGRMNCSEQRVTAFGS